MAKLPRGIIKEVTEEIHNGRRVICVELEDGRVIRNNWDGSKVGHDGGFDKRFKGAKALEGKEVEWKTWHPRKQDTKDGYEPDGWFADIRAIGGKWIFGH